jgi:hypothetical protein
MSKIGSTGNQERSPSAIAKGHFCTSVMSASGEYLKRSKRRNLGESRPAPLYDGAGPTLDFCRLSQGERILHIYAQIADRIFDFGVSEQNLHCPQISRRLVDY